MHLLSHPFLKLDSLLNLLFRSFLLTFVPYNGLHLHPFPFDLEVGLTIWFSVQAADTYGNNLLSTLANQVSISVIGDEILSTCNLEKTMNCVTTESVRSVLLVTFRPMVAVKHRISVRTLAFFYVCKFWSDNFSRCGSTML